MSLVDGDRARCSSRRARVRSTARPQPSRALGPAVGGDPRGAQARPRLAVGRPVHVADAVAAEAVAGLDVDGRRCATQPHRSVPGGVPRRHRRGAVRRPDRRRTLRRGVRRRGRGQSVPVGVRLDLHRAVREPPAAAACWTSRSRSGRSSDSPPSTARSRKVEPPAVRRSERVAIVGGGPAGMSAAWYLARLGYPVTVLEAMPVPGGMMAIGIPEYRLPREVLQEEIARILAVGVELRLDTAMGRDFGLADLEREGFKAIFLATGASKSRRLGVPGDELRGVIPATLFLKEVNLGESPRLSGDVVVVGGGSTAMDAARSARRSGAATVTDRLSPRARATCPPRPRRSRPPSARASSSSRASRRPRSSGATRPSWPSAATSCARTTATGPDGRATLVVDGRDAGAARRARSSSPSARSPTRRSSPRAPASRSAAGPGSSPIRGPSPRAGRGSSPAATSSPGRARSSRRSPPAAAPPRPSTSTSRAPVTARRRSSRRCGTATAAGGVALASTSSARPRVRAALPVVDIAVVLGHGARLHRPGGPRRGGPVLPMRRGVRLSVRPGHRRPQAGRRAASARPPNQPFPSTAAGPADQPAQGGVQ